MRVERFVEIGVDRMLDCTTVKQVDKSKDISCRICARNNFDLRCSNCGIAQCARQLEVAMKGGEC